MSVRWDKWVALGLTLSLAACDCGKKPEKVEQAAPPAAKKKPAVLIGSVRMEGGELPMYTSEQMERQVLAHAKGGTTPDVCSPPKLEDRTPVSLTPDGKLVGVMLAASEFSRRDEPAPPKTIALAIKDCRLTPKMIVAHIGDTLHISNESPFPLMPGMGAEAYNQTLTQGQTRDIALDSGGAKIIACGFSGQCGRTDVIVLAHTQATVTNAQGEFRFEDFPADETVRLNAWHPLFFETYQEVRVSPGEEKRIELVLTPKPPPKPPAPPVAKDPKNPSPD
ncbi:MAG TPA: hypothetical protein VFN67_27950 [Polyangiales bacterium]|nr:hypothetical protein [Polyangiales bacterium]